MGPLGEVAAPAGLFAAGLAAGLVACRLVMRARVLDHPDGDRKQQAAPVPRLGGVAMLAAIGAALACWVMLASAGRGDLARIFVAAPALLFVVTAFLIGLWDDLATPDTRLKLLLLAGAALGAALTGLHPDALASPFGVTRFAPVLIIGSALWLLVFTNAANFMDGANGLSIGAMTILLGGLAITGTAHGTLPPTPLWFALFGPLAAFLAFNLSGRLYAGDAGALGLGALFASLALVSGLEVWTVATFALPFLVDVLLTLIWRARRGRSWLKAHRDHAYQGLIDQGWTHFETAYAYWGLTVTCALAALIGARTGGALPFALFWVLLVAGTVLWTAQRREPPADQV